jgi:hypothetical protein
LQAQVNAFGQRRVKKQFVDLVYREARIFADLHDQAHPVPVLDRASAEVLNIVVWSHGHQ